MNVLIACEESQRVCVEFRKRGHIAFSCDILPCSGGHPEWHIQDDVLKYINGCVDINSSIFFTQDRKWHFMPDKWDLIIAFPPCTYLTVTGNSWFNIEKYGQKAIDRYIKRDKAIAFVTEIYYSRCDRVAIENPVGVLSTQFMKPSQIIQPYFFGDPFEKRTCLWLRNLPTLNYTDILPRPERIVYKSGKTEPPWHVYTRNLSPEERSIVRSKTYPGVAKAMAEQWGGIINER